MNFGSKVKALRELRRMSQGDLSRGVNITQGRISVIERLSSMPNLKVAIAIANALDVSLSDLVNDLSMSEVLKKTLVEKVSLLRTEHVNCLIPIVDMLLSSGGY